MLKWSLVFCLFVLTSGRTDPANVDASAHASVVSHSGSATVSASSEAASELDVREVRGYVAQRLREGILAVRDGKDVKAESRDVAEGFARGLGPYLLRTKVSGRVQGEGRAKASATASVGPILRGVSFGCREAFVKVEDGLLEHGARYFCSRIRRAFGQSVVSSKSEIELDEEGYVEESEEVFVAKAVELLEAPLSNAFSFLEKKHAAAQDDTAG